MPAKHLLKCSACGENIVVDTRQAGDRVRCECGAEIDVPAMRDLAKMPPSDTGPLPGGESSWGPRQGLMLLGAVIVVAAAAPLIYWVATWPEPPVLPVDEIVDYEAEQIDNMPLYGTWNLWQQILAEEDIQYRQTVADADYQQAVALRYRLVIGSMVVGVLGMLILMAGIAWRTSPNRL